MPTAPIIMTQNGIDDLGAIASPAAALWYDRSQRADRIGHIVGAVRKGE